MLDVFLHVPKTGGSSLRTSLRWIYGWRGVHTTPAGQNSPEYVAEQIGDDSRIRLVRGHLYFGIHEHLEQTCRYFTMLRDPVNRIVSLYFYIKRAWPNTSVAEMTLGEYIESDHPSYVPNRQARQLTGCLRGDCPPEALLRQSKRSLSSHITVFGLTERFDESIMLFYQRLGWTRYPFYIRTNTNQQRPPLSSLSPAVKDQIRQQNAVDCALYNYAVGRFEEKVSQTPTLRRELDRFKVLNTAVEKAGGLIVGAYQRLNRYTRLFW